MFMPWSSLASRGGLVRELNSGSHWNFRSNPGSKHGTFLEQSPGGVSSRGRVFFLKKNSNQHIHTFMDLHKV